MYNIFPSTSHCFSHPCLTLQQFATTNSFKTASNETIKLMLFPGNHSLFSNLVIANLNYLSLNASSDTKETRITCYGSSRLCLPNISESVIKGITFLECKSNMVTDLGDLMVNNCTFLGENGHNIIMLNRTKAVFKMSSFYVVNTGNKISLSEAALISHASNVTIEASELAIQQGRVLSAESESTIHIINTTISNSTTHKALVDNPSALIQISIGQLFIEESKIVQNKGEMIIYARRCTINISNSTLDNNEAANYILCIVKSRVFLNDMLVSGNRGNFSIVKLMKTRTNITGKTIFSENLGSLLIINSKVVFFGLTTFVMCSQSRRVPKDSRLQAQGTLTVIQSTVVFSGNASFIANNSTKSGGAIYSAEGKITIYGNLFVVKNIAEESGGGIFLYLTTFICMRNCIFRENQANKIGGGIHAVSSVVSLSNSTMHKEHHQISHNRLSFIENKAEYGGGLYFELNAYLKCIADGINEYSIIFKGNSARKNGGAIFIRDETYFGTCNSTSSFNHHTRTECFFQVIYNDIHIRKSEEKHSVTFINNTAGSGSVLYGGLLDRCSLSPMADIYKTSIHTATSGFHFLLHESRQTIALKYIASDAVRVCSCRDTELFHCRNKTSVFVQKGENFNISVMAVDQVNNTVNASIRSSLQEESIFGEGQQLQHTEGDCTNLTFNISSPFESVDLILYADQGPCKDKGLSSFTVKINFRNCSCFIGFIPSNELKRCECNLDPQLKGYVTAHNTSSFVRIQNSWINYIYNNGNKHMYIIHPNCPYDYCLPPSPTTGIINLNESNGADAQCNFNRAGLLCGQCKQGYSLSMSNSHCVLCPKYWPGLVIGNILAGTVLGIALVFLFLLLNLTVALGTSNGIIFYANVVLLNKSIFLPSSAKLNFFTVVIYLLNTQIGVKRCFWEGMNAYGRTWFSYVFPLYMIGLVLAIIIISKHSLKCARILGKRNPVATLATLILLSYAYLLRTILDILSFTIINYPDGTRQIVWLPDASIKYFQGKHIALLFSAIVIATIGFAYTILLFSWQWLHRLPNIVILHWVRNTKLNSFIDAYHAPYKPQYRYWTGLLLLIRVVLSVAITANVSGDPHYNLLATGILIASLVMLKVYLGDNIYKNKILDYLENTYYLNLLLFTLVTFYSLENVNTQKIVADTSIGVTFIMLLCVISYHTYYTFSKMKWCKKVCAYVLQKVKGHTTAIDDAQHLNVNATKTFNRTEVSMSDLAMSNGQEKVTVEESDQKYKAVHAIEQSTIEAYIPECLVEPLL